METKAHQITNEICMWEICSPQPECVINCRHPRVQPHMLRDLFGGDTMVENVKIVPDRNVPSLPMAVSNGS